MGTNKPKPTPGGEPPAVEVPELLERGAEDGGGDGAAPTAPRPSGPQPGAPVPEAGTRDHGTATSDCPHEPPTGGGLIPTPTVSTKLCSTSARAQST